VAAKVLVTGSSGHLGEALVRVLRDGGYEVTGIDARPMPYTTVVGSVADRAVVRGCIAGAGAVLHTATLHKPHVGSHPKQAFVDTNVTGTLTLLEEAVAAGVGSFVFTSTTSAFGRALTPASGEPAVWITEDVVPRPRNIYGVTKTAAEDLCELIHAKHGLPVLVLRTSRFFPEGESQACHRGRVAGPHQWRILIHTNATIPSTKCTAQTAKIRPVTGIWPPPTTSC
jgi:UDP-glucose 4-epimerase